MTRRRVFVVVAFIAAATAVAGTFRNGNVNYNYYVNTGSLAQLRGIGSGVDLRRVIGNSGNFWSAYAGAAKTFKDVGTTASVGCQPYNLVQGSVGQSPIGPTAEGILLGCGATWALTLYGNDNTREFFLSPQVLQSTSACLQGGTCSNFAKVVRHEFGHAILHGNGDGASAGHISAGLSLDPCLMDTTGSGAVGLCSKEIEAVGASILAPEHQLYGPGFIGLVDGGTATTSRALSAGFPTPSGWGAFAATSAPVGVGGQTPVRGYNAFGDRIDRVAYSRVDVVPHWIETCDVANCAATRVTVGGGVQSVRAPTVAYDPGRRIWYMFVVVTSEFDATLANRILVLWSSDGASWMPLSYIPDARTQVSVSATYDYWSDSFVLAWVNSDYVNAPPFVNILNPLNDIRCNKRLSDGAPYSLGCLGETIVSVIGSGGFWAFRGHLRLPESDPRLFGLTGVGAPAVICDSGGAYYQCEVFVLNYSVGRETVSKRFCLNNGGGGCGITALNNYGAGSSDYPLAMSQRRANGSGVMVLSARGTDDRFYYRTKPFAGAASWDPWVLLSTTTMVSAPSILLPSTANTYEAMMSIW